MRGRLLLAMPLAVLLVGCGKSADDDLAPAIVPKSYSFEGKLDRKYVGKWASTDGRSVVDLSPEGKAILETTTRSQAGKNTSRVEGEWLASGDSLLFRYMEKSGGSTVLKDTAKLSGDTLVMGQEGGRIKTTYKRK